ncbi:MAG: ATP-binding protein [Flavihumibacter sp.]
MPVSAMNRYFRYILLLVFLLAIALIVVLQFNSNRNINDLIGSNKVLLEHLRVKSGLENLRSEILSMDNRMRGIVINGRRADTFRLSNDSAIVGAALHKLESGHFDAQLQPSLQRLEYLSAKKLAFSQQIIDSLNLAGKPAAEKLINTRYGTKLIDSINAEIQIIDDLHQEAVVRITEQADSNGLKAKTMGSLMAVIAAIASIITFVFASLRMQQQQKLIERLNESEKAAVGARQAQEKFLANMSHEIRTPLNAILGFTNLLSRQPLDKTPREYADAIHRAGENLTVIVNDILDLSKLDAGMIRLESITFSLRDLVQSVGMMFTSKAAEKKIAFTTHIDDEVPDMLEGDPTRLTQILVNLVGNAFKFTDKGSVHIKVNATPVTGNSTRLGIEISDTGIGIRADKLEHIFDRFQQAEDTINRKYGGTGLGLTIVKELVTIQGGQIIATSEYGRGATFKMTIPYQLAAGNTVEWNTQSIATFPVPANGRLLVVEDNQLNQRLLTHLLSGWNVSFAICSDGNEAIRQLRQQPFDLVLMDIQMPGMDGYTATRFIRNELGLTIPIIAMTAHALAGEKEKCVAAGMNDYISKPIHEQQLYNLIQEYLPKQEPDAKPVAAPLPGHETYKNINLLYMRQVSQGDKVFEKTVAEEFMEGVNEEMLALAEAMQQNDPAKAARIAHNMKTTVSIMGLNEKLNPWLDAIEHPADAVDRQAAFEELRSRCNEAVAETRQFIDTLLQ